MKRGITLKGLIVILLIHTGICYAATEWLQAWTYVTDNPSISIAWDPSENAQTYEVKMISMYPVQEWTQTVTATTATFNRPRSGMFRFAVRGCNPTANPICSEWTYSDGPRASVIRPDGTTIVQPWISLFRLSAPIFR